MKNYQKQTKKQLIDQVKKLQRTVNQLQERQDTTNTTSAGKQADKALRESEALNRSLIESMADGLIVIDAEGKILSINTSFAKMFGYKDKEELLSNIKSSFDLASEDEKKKMAEGIEHTIRSGADQNEYTGIKKDGSKIDVSIHAATLKTNEGIKIIVNVRDLTEQKKTEEEIRENEKYLSSIFKAAPIGIGTVTNRVLQTVNERICEMLGYTKEELVGNDARMLYPSKEDYEYVGKEKYRQIKKFGSGTVESHLQRKDGKLINVLISSTPINPEKPTENITFSVLDITERKEYEIELQKRNAFIQTVLDNLPIGLALNEFDAGTATYINKKFEEIYGWPAEELKNISEFFKKVYPDPEYRENLMSRVLSDIQSGDPSKMHWEDCRITHKDGSKHIVNAQNIPLIEQNTMVSTVMDITEQKKAEDALRKSEEKYRGIFENSALGIFRSTPEGRYEEVNEAFAHILGFESPRKMMDGVTDISKLYKHPEDREKIKKEFADKGFVQDYEIVANHPHKETVWISVNAKQQQSPEGQIYYEGTIQDITEKKLAEKKLKESREEMSRILENSMDGILLTAPDGSVYSANPAACKMFGRSEKELCEVGREGVVDLSDPRLPEFFKIRNEKGEANTEVNLLRKDGSKFPAEVSSALFKDKDGNFKSSMIIRDITERKKVEEKLRQSEEKYHTLYNSIRDAILVTDTDRRIIDCNPAFTELFGYELSEIKGKKTEYMYHDIEQFKEMGRILKQKMNEKSFFYTINFKKKSGKVFPGETNAFYLKNENKEVIGFVGLIRDITDRLKAEESLKKTTAFLRAAMDCSTAGIAIADAPDGKLSYVNDAALGIRGKTKEEVVKGVGIENYVQSWQILHFDGTPYKKDEVPLARAILYGESCERQFIIRTEHGDRVVWANAAPIYDDKGDLIAGIVVFPDITELKKAEEKLTVSEKGLREAQRLANIGSWRLNTQTGKVYMSEQMYRLYGMSEDDQLNDVSNHEKIYTRESWQRFMDAAEKAKKTGEPYEIEMEFSGKDAKCRYAIARGEALFDDNKNVIALRGTLQDITERKQAEKELEDYKKHLEELVKERTAELEKQNKELERFNNLFVGREFRIKELREKIEELEKALGNRND